MATISEALIGMIGVIIGGGITTVGTIWTQRLQSDASRKLDQQARQNAASAAALSATSHLIQMPDAPADSSGPDFAEWVRQRDQHTMTLNVTTQDFQRKDVRDRMQEISTIINLHDAASYLTGQEEKTTRSIACDHALDCLGAFRRDEPLPSRPERYTQTLDAIHEWIEAQQDK